MKKKYFKYINMFFVVIFMILIMVFVGLMWNYGFGEDWFFKFLKVWSVMLFVVYVVVFFIIFNVWKLVERLMVKE